MAHKIEVGKRYIFGNFSVPDDKFNGTEILVTEVIECWADDAYRAVTIPDDGNRYVVFAKELTPVEERATGMLETLAEAVGGEVQGERIYTDKGVIECSINGYVYLVPPISNYRVVLGRMSQGVETLAGSYDAV